MQPVRSTLRLSASALSSLMLRPWSWSAVAGTRSSKFRGRLTVGGAGGARGRFGFFSVVAFDGAFLRGGGRGDEAASSSAWEYDWPLASRSAKRAVALRARFVDVKPAGAASRRPEPR